MGQDPSSSTLTSLVEACCRAGKVGLDRCKMRSDIYLYPSLYLYSSLYPPLPKVELAFDALQLLASTGVRPIAALYTSLIEACGRSGQPGGALSVLGVMHHAGVRPTGPTYNAVIAACVQAADLHATLAALQACGVRRAACGVRRGGWGVGRGAWDVRREM